MDNDNGNYNNNSYDNNNGGYNNNNNGYYNQQNWQQPPYWQYNQPYNTDTDLEEPVTFGDWMLTKLVMMIPIVNIVMMFVWAFSSGTKKSKSNYFKATLVWALIWIVVMILLVIGIGGLAAALISGSANSYY